MPNQAAYVALDKYKLYASQELTADQYKQGIDAFEKFLSNYPKSTHAEEVRGKLAEWKAEAASLQSGKAKFAGKWMIPEEKSLRSLQKQLADLTSERDSLAVKVAKAEGELAGLQTRLSTLPLEVHRQEHEWRTERDSHQRLVTVDHVETKTIPNPEVSDVNNSIACHHKVIDSGRASVSVLDNRIQTIQTELPEAQRVYEVALANPAR